MSEGILSGLTVIETATTVFFFTAVFLTIFAAAFLTAFFFAVPLPFFAVFFVVAITFSPFALNASTSLQKYGLHIKPIRPCF